MARGAAAALKQLEALGVACAGILDRRFSQGRLKDAVNLGFSGAAQLVRSLTGSSMAEARSRVRLALTGVPDGPRQAPRFPLVAATLAMGKINEQSASLLSTTLMRQDYRSGGFSPWNYGTI